jgi:hypothetical protein
MLINPITIVNFIFDGIKIVSFWAAGGTAEPNLSVWRLPVDDVGAKIRS